MQRQEIVSGMQHLTCEINDHIDDDEIDDNGRGIVEHPEKARKWEMPTRVFCRIVLYQVWWVFQK